MSTNLVIPAQAAIRHSAASRWRVEPAPGGGRGAFELRDGCSLRVRSGAGAASLHLLHDAVCGIEAPVLHIELEPGAELVLVEAHPAFAPAAGVRNVRLEVELGAGASLQHLRTVQPHPGERLAHQLEVRLRREARYAQCLLASGSAAHLQHAVFDLLGEGAQVRIGAVLLCADGAVEQQVRTLHSAPRTRSAIDALALASGRARAAVHADGRIAAGCDDAKVRQKLAGIPTAGQPALVLRPHLEIHHDQVEAAHGATWGALPQDALFHARQRGIGENAAKALILEGLARSVLAAAIEPSADAAALELEPVLAAAIARHLADRQAAQEEFHG